MRPGKFKDVQQLTGLTLSDLYTKVHRKQIPHFRLSPRQVIFDLDEVEQWLESKRVDSEGAANEA